MVLIMMSREGEWLIQLHHYSFTPFFGAYDLLYVFPSFFSLALTLVTNREIKFTIETGRATLLTIHSFPKTM